VLAPQEVNAAARKAATSAPELRLPTCGIVSQVLSICPSDKRCEVDKTGTAGDLSCYPVRHFGVSLDEELGALEGSCETLERDPSHAALSFVSCETLNGNAPSYRGAAGVQ
jgi:hypothetical protein